MVVRQTEDGRALMTGDQVGIEKSMYVSLCRMHWEEQTERWPVANAASAKVAAPLPVMRKKSVAKKAKGTAGAMRARSRR
jgi:hypothetical protein